MGFDWLDVIEPLVELRVDAKDLSLEQRWARDLVALPREALGVTDVAARVSITGTEV